MGLQPLGCKSDVSRALKGSGGHTTPPAGLEPVQLGQWPSWWVPRFDPERQELRCHIPLEGPLEQEESEASRNQRS